MPRNETSMTFVLLATIHLLAATTFDAAMTPQEKKSTGVYKLTEKEKESFQQWLDTNYQKKANQQAAKPSAVVSSNLPTLSENLMNSKYLKLSDDTLWNIRPEHVPSAQGWIAPVPIEVGHSTNPFFPVKLTNKVSGSSVMARKADRLPKEGSPPLSPT